jgi:hypothetical protein
MPTCTLNALLSCIIPPIAFFVSSQVAAIAEKQFCISMQRLLKHYPRV